MRCPATSVTPRAALVFGLALGVVSTLLLGLWVNWLSAGLALAANVFYVVGYTMLLKRRTTPEHRLGRRRRAASPP